MMRYQTTHDEYVYQIDADNYGHIVWRRKVTGGRYGQWRDYDGDADYVSEAMRDILAYDEYPDGDDQVINDLISEAVNKMVEVQ